MRQNQASKQGQAKCTMIWTSIVDRLSWRQYNLYDSMHKGDLSYKTKALIVKRITKDRETLALADDLLGTYVSYFETPEVVLPIGVLNIDLSQFDN